MDFGPITKLLKFSERIRGDQKSSTRTNITSVHRLGSEKRVAAVDSLGLLSHEVVEKKGTPLDTVSHLLAG